MRTYVMIARDFTPWGGMERANYELAWHIAERVREKVHLVSYSAAPSLAEHENVIWHRVPKPFGRDAVAEPLLDWTGRRVARRVATADTCVIANGGNCAWPDVNWVHAVHAAWDRRDDHAGVLYRARSALVKRTSRRNERRALRAARLVITNSERARDHVIARVGIAEERVRTVYHGVDPAVYKPASTEERARARQRLELGPERPIAAFIGALGHDRNKGFDLLFSAWAELCASSRWDADLVVAGAGAEVDLWRRRAASLRLGARIRLLGFTRDIPSLLAASDLLVSPTHYEAYGLGVHEALCSGVPVLVTRSAGIAERLPCELLLDAPPTVVELAARLRAWRDDIDGLKRRVAPVGERLRARTWADMAEDILSLVDQRWDGGLPSIGHTERGAA
jgi:glycosyltransferase involved in cell wall biosynthesis